MSKLANLPESEVSWYEQKFLSMQKQIFLDMGSMNQAYTEGGMGAINEMAAAGLFEKDTNPSATADTVHAWTQIDTAGPGGTQQLHDAAKTMAYREQHDIIQDDYDQMRQRPVTGELVTAAFSTVGQVSVPGVRTMGQYDPLTASMTVPVGSGPFGIGPHVDVTAKVSVPIATGNVADWNDRWGYFTNDTLPAYTSLLDHPENQPKTIDEIMQEPMDQRINDYRIYNRVDDLAKVFVEDTKVDVDADWKWW